MKVKVLSKINKKTETLLLISKIIIKALDHGGMEGKHDYVKIDIYFIFICIHRSHGWPTDGRPSPRQSRKPRVSRAR